MLRKLFSLVVLVLLAEGCVSLHQNLPSLSDCNDDRSCLNIAHSLADQGFVEEAGLFFKKSCTYKSAEGCGATGLFLLDLNRKMEALPFFKTSCDLGSDQACTDAVRIALDLQEWETGGKILHDQCSRNKTLHCYYAALLDADRERHTKALEGWNQLCAKDHAESCFMAAVLMERHDMKGSDQGFKNACRKGLAQACLWDAWTNERKLAHKTPVPSSLASADASLQKPLSALLTAAEAMDFTADLSLVSKNIVHLKKTADQSEIMVILKARLGQIQVAPILKQSSHASQKADHKTSIFSDDQFWQKLSVEGAKSGVLFIEEPDVETALHSLQVVLKEARREF